MSAIEPEDIQAIVRWRDLRSVHRVHPAGGGSREPHARVGLAASGLSTPVITRRRREDTYLGRHVVIARTGEQCQRDPHYTVIVRSR